MSCELILRKRGDVPRSDSERISVRLDDRKPGKYGKTVFQPW